MSRRILASALLPALCWAPAFAQETSTPAPQTEAQGAPALSSEASALREALAAYVTQAPFERGILRIEDDAAGQRVILDPVATLTEFLGTEVTFAPISIVVRKRDDGDWDVSSASPIEMEAAFEIEGETQRFSYREENQTFQGVFSSELAAFLSANARSEAISSESHESTGSSVARIGSAVTTMSAAPGADGGADVAFRQTYEDFRQTTTVSFPVDPESDPTSFGFEVSAGAIDSTATMDGARTAAIRDLYALVLRNLPELQEDVDATLKGPFGAEVKTAAEALLPLWNSIEGSTEARDVAVTSLYGEASMTEASQTLRFTGIDTDSAFDFDMSLAGIAVASEMIPEWAAPLVPNAMEIGFTVSGVDLATPAGLALAELDFTQDPPLSEETQAQIAASFDPQRIVSQLKPGFIRGEDYDIAFSGDFSFENGLPDSTITVDAGGIDAVIERLKVGAQTEPSLHEAIGILQFAKGMGRPGENGRSTWTVIAAADGSVSVNDLVVQGPTEALPEDDFFLPEPDANEDGAAEIEPAPESPVESTPRSEKGSQKAPLDPSGANANR